MRGMPQHDNKPTPIGAGVDKQRLVGAPPVELPTEPKSLGQQPMQPARTGAAPTPPVESKPTAAEVKATAESLTTNSASTNVAVKKNVPPTGPKNSRITPAIPIPTAITARAGPQVTAATASVRPAGNQVNGSVNAAALKDATQAAKAAVAVAMSKLDTHHHPGDKPPSGPNTKHRELGPENPNAGAAMDNLTKKVNEMRINATNTTTTATATATTGKWRGRGGRPGGASKVDVPNADFDFQAGNAKFNKQDLVKQAIAGSPLTEAASNGPTLESAQPDDSALPIAYNKTTSFFDNISSESKDRAENGGHKLGGREWRGEEQRKNMETFGQGSVDGNGYRGGYRGRSRGRGTRGRGFGRGGGRGQGNGFHQPTSQ